MNNCICEVHVNHSSCNMDCVCQSKVIPQKKVKVDDNRPGQLTGRDLSKFDQDILKMLCCVLKQTGPVTFSAKDVDGIDTGLLIVEQIMNTDGYIASYGEVDT